MSNKLKVLFYLKRNQKSKSAQCPVMGRIRVGNTQVQFGCKLSIAPELWGKSRASGKSKSALKINAALDQIFLLITNTYKELSFIKEQVTAEQLKVAFQGMASQQDTLISYFNSFIADFEKRVGVNREPSTFFEYKNALRHLKKYMKKKYNITDISFTALDFAFIEGFDFYLRVELKRKPNTIIGITTRLRRMIKLAIGEGIITRDPFDGYAPLRPKAEQKYLTREELDKIMNTPLDHPNRYLVRDMFLFSCFTGLAYRDMCNLTEDKIVKEADGELWIKTTRQKTGTPEEVPLLPLPLKIIEKYRHLAPKGKVLLMLSCGKMNINLKKVAAICGIERRLVFHAGRHTYASEITLSQGVPIESVSRMLGHRDLRSTRVYAKITHHKIDEDMTELEKKINDTFDNKSIQL